MCQINKYLLVLPSAQTYPSLSHPFNLNDTVRAKPDCGIGFSIVQENILIQPIYAQQEKEGGDGTQCRVPVTHIFGTHFLSTLDNHLTSSGTVS